MSSNTTSTDTGVQSTSETSSSSQPASTSASSSEPSTSGSNADNSPTSIASSTETTTSSISSSSSTPVSVSSSSSSSISTTSSITTTTSSSRSESSIPASTSNTPTTTTSSSVQQTTPLSTSSTPTTTTIVRTSVEGDKTITVTQTSTGAAPVVTPTGSQTSSAVGGAPTASLQPSNKGTSSGLSSGGTIAVAVVVPIVAIAFLVLVGLFFWRKRKQRKDAEELRRKEVEEYGYNPNNDPTLPTVGGAGVGSPDGAYEMREDGSSGYRGWGTTAVASSGRKASTTISGGQSPGAIGMAYSEGTSPTHGPVSDTRSDNALMDGRPISGEPESLGALGPAASGNRSDINRGPSNASSSYSAANRSDGSGDVPGSYGAGQYYNGNNQYDAVGSPYSPETQYGSPPGRAEMAGQPVIRDVQARRNTRIENPAHFQQQSAGISQNF